MDNVFKTIIAAALAAVTHFFGVPDIWLGALVTFIVLDYITGLAKGYITKELSSKVGFVGILKKLMYFAIVAVAVITDNVTGANGILRIAVIGFLMANEALSILENCAAANLPVPKILITVLNKLKDSGNEQGHSD